MTFESDTTPLRVIADKIFRYMIADHQPSSNQLGEVDVNPASWGMAINDWDWNPGVGVTAIATYYDFCKEPDVLGFLVDWVERNLHRARKFLHVNSMVPFAIFPDMYRWTGDQKFLEIANEYGDWIINNAVRTLTGAFQHGGDLVEEIWADTIFMVVIFLARLGNLTGDTKYAQEAVNQLLLHLQYLQDDKTGVLFHGYNCERQSHYSEARWTRGNGWIVLGTPMILSEIEKIITIPEEIGDRYQRLVDGVLSYQAQNGLWHTVMDQPDHYQETSGSACITCGILKSIRQGFLSPAPYLPDVERAVNGILAKVSNKGVVMGVSGGTPIMETIAGYNKLSQYPTLYGQGLVLMLLSEYLMLIAD
jgi:unsaturated rhamnogalacturonyl hydrolase